MPIYNSDGHAFEDSFDFHTNNPIPIEPATKENPLKVKVGLSENMTGAGSQAVPADQDPTDYTNHFNTQLSPEEQSTYDQKYSENDKYDYDMQGFHQAHPDYDPTDRSVHFPDTYKKPNHPTFSTESQYNKDTHRGGQWIEQGGGKYSFKAGDQNLRIHGKDALEDYFKRREPGNTVNFPSDPEQAQSARESAAQRMQQSHKPTEGRQTSEFTDKLGDVLMPASGVIRSAAEGEYGEAALKGLGLMAPMTRMLSPEARSGLIKGVAGLVGGTFALTPKAVGSDEHPFSFIQDPIERSSYEKQYEGKVVYRTKANGQARVDAQGKPIVDLQATNQAKQQYVDEVTKQLTAKRNEDMLHERMLQEEATARAGEETAKKEALTRFTEANQGTIDKLKPEELEHFNALTHPSDINETLKARASYLALLANQKEEARKLKEHGEQSFAQREPEAANAIRAMAIALGVIIPWGVAAGRAYKVNSVAGKVEKKIVEMRNAAKAAGRPLTIDERKIEESWFNMQKNALEAYNHLHSIDWKELAGSSIFPLTANQIIPNLVDTAALKGNPDNPNLTKAHEGLNPFTSEFWHQALPNLVEGATSSIAGAALGKGTIDFDKAKLRGKAAVETIKDEKAILGSMETNAAKPVKKKTTKEVQKHVDDTYKEMKTEQAQKKTLKK